MDDYTIEQRMDLERVSTEELANVLTVIKTVIDEIAKQEEPECDCENCRIANQQKDKVIQLQKYKMSLGLMHPEEERQFELSLKRSETNLRTANYLKAFYAKMSPHIPKERLIEIESDLNF